MVWGRLARVRAEGAVDQIDFVVGEVAGHPGGHRGSADTELGSDMGLRNSAAEVAQSQARPTCRGSGCVNVGHDRVLVLRTDGAGTSILGEQLVAPLTDTPVARTPFPATNTTKSPRSWHIHRPAESLRTERDHRSSMSGNADRPLWLLSGPSTGCHTGGAQAEGDTWKLAPNTIHP